jgi:cytosine/uracil/thiamine/allantoin permease
VRELSASLLGESFVLSVIAFLAAVIPIVFSVSTLAIQHAASNYTASVLEQYKKDRMTWFFYGFVGCGVLLAAYMLMVESSVFILATANAPVTISLLNSSFVMLAFSLVLLPWQHYQGSQTICHRSQTHYERRSDRLSSTLASNILRTSIV